MSNAKLAATDEEIIETVLRMLKSSGMTEAASLLRTARWRFEETGYDNWNGGTWTFTLYIEIAPETYAVLGDRKSDIKNEIEKAPHGGHRPTQLQLVSGSINSFDRRDTR